MNEMRWNKLTAFHDYPHKLFFTNIEQTMILKTIKHRGLLQFANPENKQVSEVLIVYWI